MGKEGKGKGEGVMGEVLREIENEEGKRGKGGERGSNCGKKKEGESVNTREMGQEEETKRAKKGEKEEEEGRVKKEETGKEGEGRKEGGEGGY